MAMTEFGNMVVSYGIKQPFKRARSCEESTFDEQRLHTQHEKKSTWHREKGPTAMIVSHVVTSMESVVSQIPGIPRHICTSPSLDSRTAVGVTPQPPVASSPVKFTNRSPLSNSSATVRRTPNAPEASSYEAVKVEHKTVIDGQQTSEMAYPAVQGFHHQYSPHRNPVCKLPVVEHVLRPSRRWVLSMKKFNLRGTVLKNLVQYCRQSRGSHGVPRSSHDNRWLPFGALSLVCAVALANTSFVIQMLSNCMLWGAITLALLVCWEGLCHIVCVRLLRCGQ